MLHRTHAIDAAAFENRTLFNSCFHHCVAVMANCRVAMTVEEIFSIIAVLTVVLVTVVVFSLIAPAITLTNLCRLVVRHVKETIGNVHAVNREFHFVVLLFEHIGVRHFKFSVLSFFKHSRYIVFSFIRPEVLYSPLPM
jgi:hypothetical protein